MLFDHFINFFVIVHKRFNTSMLICSLWQVRNESADDFFSLLKEWRKLCKKYCVNVGKLEDSCSKNFIVKYSKRITDSNFKISDGEFEVLKIVDICYGDPTSTGKSGLKFKVDDLICPIDLMALVCNICFRFYYHCIWFF